ncbi:MAG: M15 family peptidase [Proteobacteria bacterium]|nr:M15 family peptidase [Pseudomonadota bacterium]
MTLRERQSEFARKVPLLILFAYELGYEITLGDAWAKVGHCDDSCHYIRLAIDLNLFKDGEYLTKTENHLPLGLFWESIGGSWGGRFGESSPGAGDGWDGNHYSLEWQGKK